MMNATDTPKPATAAKPKKRKFFMLDADVSGGGKGHGLEITNKDDLIVPGLAFFAPPIEPAETYKQWSGFGYFKDTPRVAQKKGHRPSRDMEGYAGFWLISERLKDVLESIDPDGFAFAACDFTLADGSKGPPYYLCDVVRTLDALDEEKSKVKIKFEKDFETGEDWKIYSFSGFSSAVFKEDVVGAAHVFRTPYSISVFCDDILRDACKAEKLKGLWFIPADDL